LNNNIYFKRPKQSNKGDYNQIRPLNSNTSVRREWMSLDYYVRAEDLEELEYQESFPPVLTSRGVQNLLCIGKNKLYELLGTGELKGFRIGRDWRVKRESIFEYIGSH
jgi:excisionase family DNA binding protein